MWKKLIQLRGLYLNSFLKFIFSIKITIEELLAKNGGHLSSGNTIVRTSNDSY